MNKHKLNYFIGLLIFIAFNFEIGSNMMFDLE